MLNLEWPKYENMAGDQVSLLPCPVNGYLTTDMPEEFKEVKVESLLDESKEHETMIY